VLMTPDEWDEHETQFHLGKCLLCPMSFDDLKTMRNHHQNDHMGFETKCKKCERPMKFKRMDHVCGEFILKRLAKRKAKRKYSERVNLHIYELKEGEDPMKVRKMTTHLLKVEQNGELKWYCSYCKLEFKSRVLLKKHSKSAHQSKKYRCDICPDSENVRSDDLHKMAAHKFLKHGIVLEGYKILTCPLCSEYKTVLESHLKFHLKDSHPAGNTEAISCSICSKVFKGQKGLRAHIENIHMNIRLHSCDKCDQRFANHAQLKTHKEDKHGPDGPVSKDIKRFVCQQCGKRLKNERNLKSHISLHAEPEVQCLKCNKMFKNKVALQHHDKASHVRSLKFECPICPDKVYYVRGALREHCNFHHIKIKPLVCTTCGAEFWEKRHIGPHIAESHENWPKDKAKKEWRFLLREKPHLFKQIPILNHFKRIMGEPFTEVDPH